MDCDIKPVAIFIDYDNVYLNLEKYYEKYSCQDLKVKVIEKIKEKYKDKCIVSIKSYADFEKIKPVLTPLQKMQVELKHVYSSNNGRKNASDISLAIDIIKSLYSEIKINKYVIVSSDSDMLPIINELRCFCKGIDIIYSEYGSVNDYNTYLGTSESLSIESLIGKTAYKEITEQDIEFSIKQNLDDINEIIHKFNNKHRNGTVSFKDLKDELWKMDKYVINDIETMLNYLILKKYLIEFSTSGNTNYRKININENVINTKGIQLDKLIINYREQYSNYQEI